MHLFQRKRYRNFFYRGNKILPLYFAALFPLDLLGITSSGVIQNLNCLENDETLAAKTKILDQCNFFELSARLRSFE